ncbi:MAG: hypothetical protein P8H03_07935 [Emcibacteraceae bacterium]|nr:hypothetical protein [Emcibacteraceae bacterium]MDG1995122.1 hypothetical protein [Emcibacteraceae bacterium]
MRKIIIVGTSIVYAVFFNATLFAADLINTDEISYTVFADLDDTASIITIGPNETVSDICRDCYLEIDGDSEGVSIDQEPKVIIKDGKLIIEDTP